MALVSIFMFCKNRKATIGRAIDSLLAQTYRDIEIVVQDGASDDGTLEVLRSYGSAIDLVSAPDEGGGDAFVKVMRRCRGKYMGSCLSDEELLPDAVERAVAVFEADPDVAAITGDADIIDFEGRLIGQHTGSPFELLPYMASDHCPYFVSSFFRRQAMLDVGVIGAEWSREAIEFEIWCRLGAERKVRYVPGKFGRYGIHPHQLSNVAHGIHSHMDGRTLVIGHMFGPRGCFTGAGAESALLKWTFLSRQYAVQYHHMMCVGLNDHAPPMFDLFLRYARELAREMARLAGEGYDDAVAAALIAADPGRLFMPDGREWIARMFEGLPPAGAESPLPPLVFAGERPLQLKLPPMAAYLYRIAAAEFEHLGRHQHAERCRMLAESAP